MPDQYGNPTYQDMQQMLQGMSPTQSYVDTSLADSQAKNAELAAQSAYYNALGAGQTQNAATAAAQLAWQKNVDAANMSGYFPGSFGYGTVAGQPTFPNLQYATNTFGQYQPGGLGAYAPGTSTLQAQNQAQQYGLNQANVTGVYYDPGQMIYAPGTYIYDQDTGGIGQIQSNGRMQEFGSWGDFVRSGGNPNILSNPDMVRKVSETEYSQMANNPGANFAGGAPGGTPSIQLQQMYGGYGMPTAGQQTLAAQQQNAQLYGANAAPTAGQQTLAAQQQYWQQAFNQQQFQAQQGQLAQQNTLSYLQQLANLRGPADWAKYQQVLGSTPQGMKDLYAAAMGQYVPGGGATTGQQPQAVSLGTMQQQIAGYNPQAQASGGQVWGSGIGVGSQPQSGAQDTQATGNGTNMYGGQQQQYNLPAPNQISSQAWNNFTPSQQQMLLGQYEASGWDKNDVQALYNQSLPKYGSSNQATAGTWSLK